MKRKYLTLFLVFNTAMLYAQQLEVKRIELSGDDVIFYYTLLDSVPNRLFTINLYTSRDNYISPLEKLSGDVGQQIKSGNDRKVIWNARQELGDAFDGRVAVEIRARVYIPFLTFESFSKVKRGKATDIIWRGGARQHTLNFDLYNKKNEKVTTVIPNINAAAGHTSLTIPSDIKPGKGYRLKIVDNKNKDLYVESTPFTIKRKIPLLLIALPIAAAGGAASLLGGEKKGGGSGAGDMEGPPNPPD